MRRWTLTLLTLALAAPAFAQRATVPVLKPVVGQEVVYEARIDFQAMGQDAVFTGKMRRTVVSVADDGSSEVQTASFEQKILIMGGDQDQPDREETIKIGSDGFPVERQPHDSELEEVLGVFGRVRVPADGIEVGKSWDPGESWPDDRYGKTAFTVTGRKDVGGRDCWEVSVTYSALDGSGSAKGVVWLEAKSGLPVGFEANFEDVTVAAGIVSGGKAVLTLVSAKGF
jgi:hypothetical protein